MLKNLPGSSDPRKKNLCAVTVMLSPFQDENGNKVMGFIRLDR